MTALLIVIVALLAIAVVYLVFERVARKRAAEAREAADLRDRAYGPKDPFSSADADAVHGNPRTLKPGDVVEIREQTYAVRGVLTLTQDGFSWTENFIDTGTGRKAWISVEDDPDLEVVMWTEIERSTLTPGPDTIDFDGRSYVSDEAGSARFSSVGTTGLTTGNMQYHDYSAGTARLSFENFGSGWEAARGEVLQHEEYRIYPADDGTSE